MNKPLACFHSASVGPHFPRRNEGELCQCTFAAVRTRFIGPGGEEPVLQKEANQRQVFHRHEHLNGAAPPLPLTMVPGCRGTVPHLRRLQELHGFDRRAFGQSSRLAPFRGRPQKRRIRLLHCFLTMAWKSPRDQTARSGVKATKTRYEFRVQT